MEVESVTHKRWFSGEEEAGPATAIWTRGSDWEGMGGGELPVVSVVERDFSSLATMD